MQTNNPSITAITGTGSVGGQTGPGVSGQIGIYGAGNIVAGNSRLTDNGTLLSYTGTSGISSLAVNNIQYANAFAGATANAKILAAINALPSTGGVVDARGLQGAQSWAANPFAGITKSVTLWLGDTVISVTAGVTILLSGINNLFIIGSGINRTIFQFANAGAVDGFRLASSNVHLSDFTIDMTSTGTGSGFHVVGGGDEYIWERLEVKNSGSYGFFLDPGAAGVERWYAEEILTHDNAGHGFYGKLTVPGVGLAVGLVNHLEAFNNGGDGIKLESTALGSSVGPILFNMPRVEHNTGNGVNLVACTTVTFQQIEAEANGGWGIAIDANTTVGQTIKRVASQTADLLTFLDENGNPLAGFKNLGDMYNRTIDLNSATPSVAGGHLGLGTTTGFGNGGVPTAVTTVLLGTGSGPTTPQTIIGFLKINVGGTDHWVPYMT